MTPPVPGDRELDDIRTIESYTRLPIPDDDLSLIDEAAARMILDEPW